jgi:hypothetical protein
VLFLAGCLASCQLFRRISLTGSRFNPAPAHPVTTIITQAPGIPPVLSPYNIFSTAVTTADEQGTIADDGYPASMNNQATLLSNQIPEPTPASSQPFNIQTNNEMQLPVTEIQLAASMAYSGINNNNNNTPKPQIPQTTYTPKAPSNAGYISYIKIFSAFFSTIPCPSQHYPASAMIQASPTIGAEQTGAAETDSNNNEILTIIKTLTLTTTCTLPHLPIATSNFMEESIMNGSGGGGQIMAATVIETLVGVGAQGTEVASQEVKSVASNTTAWSCVFDLVFSFLFLLLGVWVGF